MIGQDVTRLEKVAVDAGFDLPGAQTPGWLAFASSHARLFIWLGRGPNAEWVAALSQAHVGSALEEHGTPVTDGLPGGAAIALSVENVPALLRLLRRAYQLSRTLPNELLAQFENKIRGLPRATEAERWVVQRIGQDEFRRGLLEYWQGRCAITGIATPALLRASHIKPWADCVIDAERLDIYNGLLLSPNLDAVFDAGLITFDAQGAMVCSPQLASAERDQLGLTRPMASLPLKSGHAPYLTWHRAHVFQP